ncbi:unnamed protein product [Camellia sinensis]
MKINGQMRYGGEFILPTREIVIGHFLGLTKHEERLLSDVRRRRLPLLDLHVQWGEFQSFLP